MAICVSSVYHNSSSTELIKPSIVLYTVGECTPPTCASQRPAQRIANRQAYQANREIDLGELQA